MKTIVFDIESNGLLDKITKIHCISVLWTDANGTEAKLYVGEECLKAIDILKGADLLVGHNIIAYDILAIEKIYGIKLTNKVFDTMIAAQLFFPEIKAAFYTDKETGKQRFVEGKHNLKAWGCRLGIHKDHIETDWSKYTDEMGLYCLQDTKVTHELYKYLVKQNWPQRSIDFEMEVAPMVASIGNKGLYFDIDKAQLLYSELLQERHELLEQVHKLFKPWYSKDSEIVPKVKSDKYHYTVGAPLTKITLNQFNPGSRDHITRALKTLYNWVPVDFTDKGHVKLNSEILESLPYTEAQGLSKLFAVDKMIGQLATGKQAWLSAVKDDNRIHGFINQNGTRTGRCSHASPNISQIPKDKRCRSLFKAAPGNILIGCDFTGLEFAVFAGYMKKYDNGRIIQQVLHGDKDQGTDVHSMNAAAMGIDREKAKTVLYAVLYGSGYLKTGSIMNPTLSAARMTEMGKQVRADLLESMKGMDTLLKDLQKSFRSRAKKGISEKGYNEWTDGWVSGLDGRHVQNTYEFKALNALIQSAGALITKRGLVEVQLELSRRGYTLHKEYSVVIYSHDEIQLEVIDKPEIIKDVSEAALIACKKAGEYFNFPCPMSGEVKVGYNWSETH